MTTIYLDPAMVPATMRGNYTGKQFQARVCDSVHIPRTAGLWDGGSRDHYYGLELATGRELALPFGSSAPWSAARRDVTVDLKPGQAVVRHTMFCGKDMGLTFYVHPENATALLPAPVELTELQQIVLRATKSFKSSYAGKDRYDMAKDEYRYRQGESFPSRDEWNAAKQSLIDGGYLNKAGAITVKGKNALPSRY